MLPHLSNPLIEHVNLFFDWSPSHAGIHVLPPTTGVYMFLGCLFDRKWGNRRCFTVLVLLIRHGLLLVRDFPFAPLSSSGVMYPVAFCWLFDLHHLAGSVHACRYSTIYYQLHTNESGSYSIPLHVSFAINQIISKEALGMLSTTPLRIFFHSYSNKR